VLNNIFIQVAFMNILDIIIGLFVLITSCFYFVVLLTNEISLQINIVFHLYDFIKTLYNFSLKKMYNLTMA
jgi:hypothetical protein